MRLDITSRTVAGFSVMASILVLVSLGVVLYLDRLQRLTEAMLDQNVSSLLAAGHLESAVWDQQRGLASFLLTGEQQRVERLLKDQDDFRATRRQAGSTARSPQEQETLARIDTLYAALIELQQEVLARHRAGRAQAAQDLLLSTYRTQSETLLEACRSFRQLNEQLIEKSHARLLRDNAHMRRAMWGVAWAGVLIGALLGVAIGRSTVRPLIALVLKMGRARRQRAPMERLDLSEGNAMASLEQGVESLIQEVKSTSTDLSKSQEMLAQAEKLAAAGQLAAGIAHEIRNPLAAVKTIVFALQSELAPGDARRADFEIMGEEIEQMERAIQRFLDFARPQEPVFALVSMRQALANAAALLSRQAQEQGVELAVRAETDLVVRADRRQLEQVFVNLMLNALQVMPDGGRLSAVLRQDHRPAGGGERGEWVEAEIADTGPGIPEPLLARIFDPFVTGRAGGVGLGLAIVRQIVGQHQGRISVRNQPAGGAAFTLRLPAMEGQAE